MYLSSEANHCRDTTFIELANQNWLTGSFLKVFNHSESSFSGAQEVFFPLLFIKSARAEAAKAQSQYQIKTVYHCGIYVMLDLKQHSNHKSNKTTSWTGVFVWNNNVHKPLKRKV